MAARRAPQALSRSGWSLKGITGRLMSCVGPVAVGGPHQRKLQSRSDGEAGFTLVEVIVALAMLSLGLSLLLGLISGGLNRTGSASRMAEAGSLAQSLLAQAGTDWPIKPDDRGGSSPNGYRWHVRMLPYADRAAEAEMPVGLYRVSAEVEWDEGAGSRSYALTTLRLGPKAQRP